MIRKAKIPDLDQVIHLLYDDGLGRDRESISNKYKQKYLSVFSELLESKYFDIFVMEINNEIIIRDMLGKIIMNQPFMTISDHLLQLDVSDLSTGSYFLTMTIKNVVVTKKIVIE